MTASVSPVWTRYGHWQEIEDDEDVNEGEDDETGVEQEAKERTREIANDIAQEQLDEMVAQAYENLPLAEVTPANYGRHAGFS